jgi:hypothetical protein
MQSFFRGWKRKVGLVTLVLAGVFTFAWVHTIIMYELLKITSDQPSPFSWIAVSLTVLSCWLLLSKQSQSI